MSVAVSALALSCRLDRMVLDRLSFEVCAGERIVLLGRNGVGKSTLLRCLAGLTKLHHGSVVRGYGRVAFVGHASMFYLNLTLRANLEFFSKMNENPFPHEGVERWGLRDSLDMPVHALSQGTRLKGALVRAFASNAGLLLLDEPSSNLDDEAVTTLVAEVQHVSEPARKGAVILATHDVGRLAKVATRAFLLHDRGITASSPTPEGIQEVLAAYREGNR